jgi:hypothetical protein
MPSDTINSIGQVARFDVARPSYHSGKFFHVVGGLRVLLR